MSEDKEESTLDTLRAQISRVESRLECLEKFLQGYQGDGAIMAKILLPLVQSVENDIYALGDIHGKLEQERKK